MLSILTPYPLMFCSRCTVCCNSQLVFKRTPYAAATSLTRRQARFSMLCWQNCNMQYMQQKVLYMQMALFQCSNEIPGMPARLKYDDGCMS